MNLRADKKQHKFSGAIAAILCVWLFVGVVFSSFYVADECHHKCIGDGCPICQTIAICESFINGVGAGVFIPAVTITVFFAVMAIFSEKIGDFCSATLVSNKVRLNN